MREGRKEETHFHEAPECVPHLISITDVSYYPTPAHPPCASGEETEAQRGEVTCLKSPS